MKSNIANFSLYGEAKASALPDFIHCETIETRSKANDWQIKPHVHTYLYQIFLFESGDGNIIHEGKELKFKAPCVVTIPANTVHGFNYHNESNGRVITLSDSFLDNIFKSQPKINIELNKFRLINAGDEIETFNILSSILLRISYELHNDLPEKTFALQAYLSIFLIEVFRFVSRYDARMVSSDNRNLKYFQAFNKSIKATLLSEKSIADYARELNITPVHLNRVCQAVVGKSALQVAQDFIVMEAEKYLKHTEYSVSEIAYRLNFNDPAYFSRFFKKQTGVSPKEFRN